MRPPKAAALPLIDTSLLPTRLHEASFGGLDARSQIHGSAGTPGAVGALAQQTQRPGGRVDVRTSTSPRNDIVAGPTLYRHRSLVAARVEAFGDLRPGHAPGNRFDVLQEFPRDLRRARHRKRLVDLDLHADCPVAARYLLLMPSALHCCHTR